MSKLLAIVGVIIASIILGVSIYVQPREFRQNNIGSDTRLISPAASVGNVGNEEKEEINVLDKQRNDRVSSKTAKASWYGTESCTTPECRMANGKVFDPDAFTVACLKNYKLGTWFRFTHGDKTIEAECTDRGGFERYGREFDFSQGLFRQFADIGRGTIQIYYEVIN